METEPFKGNQEQISSRKAPLSEVEEPEHPRDIALNHLTMSRYDSLPQSEKDAIADYASRLVDTYQGNILAVSDVEAFSAVCDTIESSYPFAIIQETFLKIHERLAALSEYPNALIDDIPQGPEYALKGISFTDITTKKVHGKNVPGAIRYDYEGYTRE